MHTRDNYHTSQVLNLKIPKPDDHLEHFNRVFMKKIFCRQQDLNLGPSGLYFLPEHYLSVLDLHLSDQSLFPFWLPLHCQ